MSTKRILVVEDDNFFREALVDVLTKKKYEVVAADNGRTAKEILATQGVDLILSDIQMPHLTGPELLEWVNERTQTPCVLMTGFSNLLETMSAHELGAKGFLSKPFSNTDLFHAIESIIGSPPQPDKIDLKSADNRFYGMKQIVIRKRFA